MTRETAAWAAVSDALWMQRDTLQTLLYRLTRQQLLGPSEAEPLRLRAAEDVRAAVEELRGGELIRAVEVEELTRILGLDRAARLAELAAAAPQPWRTVLAQHRAALRELVDELGEVAPAVQQLSLVEFLR